MKLTQLTFLIGFVCFSCSLVLVEAEDYSGMIKAALLDYAIRNRTFLQLLERHGVTDLPLLRHRRQVATYQVKCYPDYGCFENSPPYHNLLGTLPFPPGNLATKFYLYTRRNPLYRESLDMSVLAPQLSRSHYNGSAHTKFIVHGFTGNGWNQTDWPILMKNELLKRGNWNIIVVDWQRGAMGPNYLQAAANTRLIGAQISRLIGLLSRYKKQSGRHFHIIGFSLGAQVAGYAGERTPNLGRITGLDPAGPFFENLDKRLRLDQTDATFVDVIHTNGLPLLPHLGLGVYQAAGHLDFYPNGGQQQVGCAELKFDPAMLQAMFGQEGFDSCHHHRAVFLFLESINSKCQFVAYPCGSGSDFLADKCEPDYCTPDNCLIMGLSADLAAGRRITQMRGGATTPRVPAPSGFVGLGSGSAGAPRPDSGTRFFLRTGRKSPYCLGGRSDLPKALNETRADAAVWKLPTPTGPPAVSTTTFNAVPWNVWDFDHHVGDCPGGDLFCHRSETIGLQNCASACRDNPSCCYVSRFIGNPGKLVCCNKYVSCDAKTLSERNLTHFHYYTKKLDQWQVQGYTRASGDCAGDDLFCQTDTRQSELDLSRCKHWCDRRSNCLAFLYVSWPGWNRRLVCCLKRKVCSERTQVEKPFYHFYVKRDFFPPGAVMANDAVNSTLMNAGNE